MALKYKIAFFLFALSVMHCSSQVNYLSLQLSSFALKQKPTEMHAGVSGTSMLHFNGTYIGESFQIGFNQLNSFGIGLGLTKINYAKQWLGIVPDNNKFGAATLNGKCNYLSLPFSLSILKSVLNPDMSYQRSWHTGITLSYFPSFQVSNKFSLQTYAAADSSAMFSAYAPAIRNFQHNFNIGFCNSFSYFNNNVLLLLEPYLGLGSSYFKTKAQSATFSCGFKIQVCIHFAYEKIYVERRVNPEREKRKSELKRKQKEIQDQINNQPNKQNK